MTAKRVLVIAVAFAALTAVSAAAQRATYKAPRTPWGDPDLQGTWPSGPLMSVPFERFPDLGNRAVLSDEEAAARNAAVEASLTAPVSPQAFLNPFWNEYGRAPALTSLVVDPENGRLPEMTADGARRAKEWQTKASPNYPYARAEDFRPYDRCITRGVLGSAFPNVYSTGMQILQAPGVVIIRHEMIHETRVIPLDGRPHVNAETLQYEVRIEDPQTWTRPWAVAFPLRRDESYVLYEYACHEGNYAIRNILSAVRAAERP